MIKKIHLTLILSLLANPAFAKKLEHLFDDWHVLTTTQASERVCYIASVPKDEKGNFKKRSEPYLLVSKFDGRNPEVSVSSGYGYKVGSSAEFTIGKSLYKLRKIQGEVAWAENTEIDAEVISAMKAGNSLDVRGTSTIGTYSIDTYSLKGFTKAYEKMVALCK